MQSLKTPVCAGMVLSAKARGSQESCPGALTAEPRSAEVTLRAFLDHADSGSWVATGQSHSLASLLCHSVDTGGSETQGREPDAGGAPGQVL